MQPVSLEGGVLSGRGRGLRATTAVAETSTYVETLVYIHVHVLYIYS